MRVNGFINGQNTRIRIWLAIALLGLLIFILGVKPELFGLDRSPVTGFIQIMVFLAGLALICIGGYACINVLWEGREKTIAADIGLRLVSTGYVISLASGLADLLGFGSQTSPNIPYFGPLQALGVMLGELIILVGFLLLVPYPRKPDSPPPILHDGPFDPR